MTDAVSSSTAPDTITPDSKDWTWVLERPCPECGYVAADLAQDQVGPRLLDAVADLRNALAAPDAGVRPEPGVWSALEYGCHVHDVCRIFLARLELMLDEDDPLFANWDQDQTALADRYAEQDPTAVSQALGAAAEALAARFGEVTGPQWARPGRRSDGAAFTVTTFSQYLVHDPVHHAWDVRR